MTEALCRVCKVVDCAREDHRELIAWAEATQAWAGPPVEVHEHPSCPYCKRAMPTDDDGILLPCLCT